MKISEHLIAAKALIDTPDKWTQGAYARTDEGHKVNVHSNKAACFCSLGALRKEFGVDRMLGNNWVDYKQASIVLTDAIHFSTEFTNIPDFNDNVPHEEVMKAWDVAIKMAKSRGI